MNAKGATLPPIPSKWKGEARRRLRSGSHASPMAMAMVQVGQVRVVVRQGEVRVHMGVRLGDGPLVLVLVVLVVDMEVLVDRPFVGVRVTVLLAKKERDARGEDDHRRSVHLAHPLSEQRHGGERAHERRRRE
jgi:hypothetical protein